MEVARLEGHSAQCQMLDQETLSDKDKGELAPTRDEEQWKPYNPIAEREVRIDAEFGRVEWMSTSKPNLHHYSLIC